MDNKAYPFTPMTISLPNYSLGPLACKENYCSQNVDHLGYAKLHGFHDNQYTILKHGQ